MYWIFFSLGFVLFILATLYLFKSRTITKQEKIKLTTSYGQNFLMRLIYSVIDLAF